MKVTPHLLYTKIELDNDETKKLLHGTDVTNTLMGLGALIEPVTTTILVTLVRLQRTRIEKANKGNGVIITIPHVGTLVLVGIKTRE